ncbi:integrase core domain-containing protein [Roseomonas rosulenta]|uniref:integrase core domain-containing protein n=1 Tax=Roseomonas rosulenta TaxID=2748667 RepID=UPI0038D175F5
MCAFLLAIPNLPSLPPGLHYRRTASTGSGHDAWVRLEAWRREYNEERPHGSLRNLTPRAFAEQAQHVVL